MKHIIPSSWRRVASCWLLGIALLAAAAPALAQQDPPGRVASLDFHQGTVSFSPAGDDSWYDLVPNRPLTTGDRLWTDRDARAELHLGSIAVRLDEQSEIVLSELDDDTARLTTMQGNMQVRVRDDLAGQRLEIDTGNLAVVIHAPGDYRIEADPALGTTRVAVTSGNATLYGEGGQSVAVASRQQYTMSGRNLAIVNGAPAPAATAFDTWVAERDRLEDQSVAARYIPREVVGYQQLDNYGDWQNDPDYGNVWYPRNVDAEWAPYRDGQWMDVAPWGWTWIDAAPWGFAPSHYGRWARIGPRWAWVPGRPGRRPVYAPALVGFVGGQGPSAGLAIGGGRNGVGWFPLAPGEAWRPGYRASQRYIDEANRNAVARRNPARAEAFAHRHTPGALTVVPVDVFGRGPIGRRDAVRLPEGRIARVPVGTAAPIPLRNDRGFGGFGRLAAAPPAAPAAPALTPRQPQAQLPQQVVQPPQQREPQRQRQAQWQDRNPARVEQREQFPQHAAQAQQMQQMHQAQQTQQMQQAQQQQREAMRQQQESQRAAQAQAQQQMHLQRQQQQQAARQQQEIQQRAAQQQAQQAQIQQQQTFRMQQQQQQQQMQAQQQAQQERNAARQAREAPQQQRNDERQQRGGREFFAPGVRP